MSLHFVPFGVYVPVTDSSETDLNTLAVVGLVVSLSLVYIRKLPKVFACHAYTSNLVRHDTARSNTMGPGHKHIHKRTTNVQDGVHR